MENVIFVLTMSLTCIVGLNGAIVLSTIFGHRSLTDADRFAMRWGTIGIVALLILTIGYEIHTFLESK